jgi:hypothetical protein
MFLKYSSMIFGLRGSINLGGAGYRGGDGPAPAFTLIARSDEVGRLLPRAALKILFVGLFVKIVFFLNWLYLDISSSFMIS